MSHAAFAIEMVARPPGLTYSGLPIARLLTAPRIAWIRFIGMRTHGNDLYRVRVNPGIERQLEALRFFQIQRLRYSAERPQRFALKSIQRNISLGIKIADYRQGGAKISVSAYRVVNCPLWACADRRIQTVQIDNVTLIDVVRLFGTYNRWITVPTVADPRSICLTVAPSRSNAAVSGSRPLRLKYLSRAAIRSRYSNLRVDAGSRSPPTTACERVVNANARKE